MTRQTAFVFTETDAAPPLSLRPIDQALIAFMQRQFAQASLAQCQLAGLVSHQLADGHLCLPLEQLPSLADQFGICQADFNTLVMHNPLISTDGSAPLVHDSDALYLHRYWQLEMRITERIRQRLAQPTQADIPLQPWLERLFPAADAAALEGTPDWQKVACALAGRRRFGIITGGPGTGKTTTVVKLLALHQLVAQANQQPPLTIKLAAPTGKAAARLAESISKAFSRLQATGIEPSLLDTLPADAITLHRLLGTQRHTRHYKHNHRNPIHADLVVVDEASMIDIDLMDALLDALPDHCTLVLVGDKDQLESVEAGAVMGDLCRDADQPAYTQSTLAFLQQAGCSLASGQVTATEGSALAQATVQLQKSWRAQNAPHILALAAAINQQNAQAANAVFQQATTELARQLHTQQHHRTDWIRHQLVNGETGLGRLMEIIQTQRPDSNASKDSMIRWALTALKQLGKQQLLSPLRQGPAGVTDLNQQIKLALQQQGLLAGTGFGSHAFAEGEPVLVTHNRYDLGLMNGDLGLALEHPQYGLRIAFSDPREKSGSPVRWVLPEHLMDYCQGGFAITVHQSQGSEYQRVLLYLPDQDTPVLGKELLYTAVTRASEQFVLLESDAAPHLLQLGSGRSSQRHTRLAQRLETSVAPIGQ